MYVPFANGKEKKGNCPIGSELMKSIERRRWEEAEEGLEEKRRRWVIMELRSADGSRTNFIEKEVEEED